MEEGDLGKHNGDEVVRIELSTHLEETLNHRDELIVVIEVGRPGDRPKVRVDKEDQGTLVTWAFVAVDGSAINLRVESEYTGEGVPEAVISNIIDLLACNPTRVTYKEKKTNKCAMGRHRFTLMLLKIT